MIVGVIDIVYCISSLSFSLACALFKMKRMKEREREKESGTLNVHLVICIDVIMSLYTSPLSYVTKSLNDVIRLLAQYEFSFCFSYSFFRSFLTDYQMFFSHPTQSHFQMKYSPFLSFSYRFIPD